MNLNTRRNFIRTTALGVFALSTGSFAMENNTKNLNLAKLFKGGVRFLDVKRIIESCFPELLNQTVLVKVRCNVNNHLHSIASAEFLQNVENLKSKHSGIKIDTMISDSFDIAHYNYQAYMQLLKIELNNMTCINSNMNCITEKMDLTKLSKTELLAKCEEIGIKKCKTKNKEELK